MQKVEGSSPFSRFTIAPPIAGFSCVMAVAASRATNERAGGLDRVVGAVEHRSPLARMSGENNDRV
jgi:hypothetical protein